MLPGLEFQPEYGLIGAGPVNASLIGRLPGKAQALGPVAGVSLRVASRIANTLRAGRAVRCPRELSSVKVILVHAPAGQLQELVDLLKAAALDWKSKSLIFCDCEAVSPEFFRAAGAGVASLRTCPIPGRLVLEGNAPALARAHRFARELKMKAVEIEAGSGHRFGAAMMLGCGAITPLVDKAAELLRSCGLRDTEAAEMAAAVFAQTAREYLHSGKQSWEWYVREPDPETLRRRIESAGERISDILARLVLLGTEEFDKHPGAASVAKAALRENKSR